jgi:hypothetical protein
MTIKEALIAELQIPGVDDALISKVLADADLSEDALYTGAMAVKVRSAAIEALLSVWTIANISEGGYSISYDRNAIKSRLLFLAGLAGRQDIIKQLTPTVTGKRPW